MQRPRYTKLCLPVLGSGVVWTEVPFARKPWEERATVVSHPERLLESVTQEP